MVNRIIPRALWFLLVLSFIPSSVPGCQLNFSARVRVTVNSKDFTLQNNLLRHLNSKLRAIQGVTVTDVDEQYNITIVAVDLKDVTETPAVALAVLITEKVDADSVKALVRDPQKDFMEILQVLLEDSEIRRSFYLQTGPASNVETYCENIVSAFDAKTLEPARKSVQGINERIQKNKKR